MTMMAATSVQVTALLAKLNKRAVLTMQGTFAVVHGGFFAQRESTFLQSQKYVMYQQRDGPVLP